MSPEFLNAAIIMPRRPFDLVYGAELRGVIERESNLVAPLADPGDLGPEADGWLSEVEVLFTGWGAPRLNEPLLQRMPGLRAVFHAGGTVRQIVSDSLWERGVILTTAAGANAVPVAEFTFACIILALKRAWHLARMTRELRDFPNPVPSVPGCFGSVVGVVSLGRIARLLCERLHTLDVEILAYDPVVDEACFRECGATRVDLQELIAASDVVSVHAPWLPETEGLITGELVRQMKPGATLINTARGAVVKEDELCAVLGERPDLHAVLDVTWPEPPGGESKLYDLPNVFLTPHIAGSQARECRRMGRWVIEDFRRYVRGEPLVEQVTRLSAQLRA